LEVSSASQRAVYFASTLEKGIVAVEEAEQ
jgi:hypothetical protein